MFDTVLRTLLTLSPERFGYHATYCTVPLLQDQLRQNLGEVYSDDTIRRALHRAGYVWKRPRYVLMPDPERKKKTPNPSHRVWFSRGHVILAEDETDLLLFSPLRAMWLPRGRPGQVMLSGRNVRRVVFGAMNLTTGHRLFLMRERQYANDFQAFLREVRRHYRGWHVVLLLDSDPSHTAHASQALVRRLGLRLLWLPKRAPELNPRC